MATTHIEGLECLPNRSVAKTLVSCTSYGKNPKKTRNGELVTAINCCVDSAYIEMLFTQKEYEQVTGKKVNECCGTNPKTGKPKKSYVIYTIRQSFDIGEVDEDTAHEIGVKLAQSYLGNEYQYTVSTHIDKAHIHSHIYFNAVAMNANHKFNCTSFEWKKVREISDNLCKEYGLSIVVPSKDKRSKVYSKCKPISFREVVRVDIDKYLQLSKSYDEFLTLMSKDYIVNDTGKYLKFKHRTNGQERFVRAYTLGDNYTDENIKKYFTINRVPDKKLKISFVEKIKAKGHKKITNDLDLSYSEKLNNIKAIFFSIKVINDNDIIHYSDFSKSINNIKQSANDIQTLIDKIENDIHELNSLITSINIYNENKPIFDDYENSLLKQKFYNANEHSLKLFEFANEKLSANNIEPTIISKNKIENIISNTQVSLKEIKLDLAKTNAKIATIEITKETIDNLNNNSPRLIKPYLLKLEKDKNKDNGR